MTDLSLGYVTTKTWAYSGMFGFFRKKFQRKKMSPLHPKHFLKIQWKIHFWNAIFWDKTLLKNFRTVIIQHFIKNLFSDLFPDLGKCPNQKTHEIRKYAYLCVFSLGHFPRPGIESENSFWDKVLYIYCLSVFQERFVPKNGVPKMDFQLYFQKVIWVEGGHFFSAEIFF